MKKYRIIISESDTYTVQVWRAWVPFWCDVMQPRKFKSKNEAEKYIQHKKDYKPNYETMKCWSWKWIVFWIILACFAVCVSSVVDSKFNKPKTEVKKPTKKK